MRDLGSGLFLRLREFHHVLEEAIRQRLSVLPFFTLVGIIMEGRSRDTFTWMTHMFWTWIQVDGSSQRFKVHPHSQGLAILLCWLDQESLFLEEKVIKSRLLRIYMHSTQWQWHGIRDQEELVHHQLGSITPLILSEEPRCTSSVAGTAKIIIMTSIS